MDFFEQMEARIPHGEVRTRFAPSPTGYMHVGNLRTALYTWPVSYTHLDVYKRQAFDTVNMAVGHKDPNVVKLQRQTLRNRRGIVAVAGNLIKIRFLTGKG